VQSTKRGIHSFRLLVRRFLRYQSNILNDANAIGHIQGITVLCQTNVGLLLPIRADEGVDLGALHIVELLHSFLDFGFGGLDIHQKHQSVDLLNLLHGGLCGHRALDDAVLVQLVPSRLHGLSRVFAIPGLFQGLGLVEANLPAFDWMKGIIFLY